MSRPQQHSPDSGARMNRTAIVRIGLILAAGSLASATPSFLHSQTKPASAPAIQPPPGYRDWRLISVAHEAGALNDIRAILGNDTAIAACRTNAVRLPEGAILARLAWEHLPSEPNNKAFGRDQSFVAGPPTNVQFMIKDSARYASTGGWGFAQSTNGRPANEADATACFSCHQAAKDHDFVFTHYAP
jgi:hypothetical protein